ncbi:MAG: hypothetical protein ACP5E2_03330 [Terracidiphilus sp.]
MGYQFPALELASFCAWTIRPADVVPILRFWGPEQIAALTKALIIVETGNVSPQIGFSL